MVVVVERVQKLFKLLSLLSNKAYHILLHANAKITILLIHEEFKELRDFGQRYSGKGTFKLNPLLFVEN
jgi:hypothetical protein